MKGPLVFSATRWRRLRESGDPLTLEILGLMERHHPNAVATRANEIRDQLYVPEKRKPGRKAQWRDGSELYVWFAIEKEWRLAKMTNPRAGLEPVVRALFLKLTRKRDPQPLDVPFATLRTEPNKPATIHDLGIPKVTTAGRALTLYYQGQRFLDAHPAQAARWNRILDRAIATELSTVRK